MSTQPDHRAESSDPEIDLSRGFAWIRVGTGCSLQSFKQVFGSLLQHPDYRPGMNALWDLRGSDFGHMSNAELRETIGWAAGFGDRRAGARVALLADEDLTYGIARMSELLADPLPIEMRVFREEKEALAWVAP